MDNLRRLTLSRGRHRPPTSEDKRPTKREHSEEREETQNTSPAKTPAVKEEEPPLKKMKEEVPSEERVPQEEEEEEEQDVEEKAEPCESVAEVNNEHTEERDKDMTDMPDVELKPLVSVFFFFWSSLFLPACKSLHQEKKNTA